MKFIAKRKFLLNVFIIFASENRKSEALCYAVCKFSVYFLILSITFDTELDLSHCGISYSFTCGISSDFQGKLLERFSKFASHFPWLSSHSAPAIQSRSLVCFIRSQFSSSRSAIHFIRSQVSSCRLAVHFIRLQFFISRSAFHFNVFTRLSEPFTIRSHSNG